MENSNLQAKLKPEYSLSSAKQTNGIFVFEDDNFSSGNNNKYMKMYNWMSYGYDFVETVYDKLNGNKVAKFRTEMLQKLEWKNNISVLCVSVGTGKDLKFIPAFIDKKSLDITGIDISLGMIKQCKRKFGNKLNLSLINCSAEKLPFKDEMFDMVFHVGGINFFNDKKVAIAEMLRVAKQGTKLLIADETGDYIESQYKKSIFSKKYFNDVSFDISEIESAIPGTVNEKENSFLMDNKFYCITFRK